MCRIAGRVGERALPAVRPIDKSVRPTGTQLAFDALRGPAPGGQRLRRLRLSRIL